MALNDKHPSWFYWPYGWALFEAGRYEDSLRAANKFPSPASAQNQVHYALRLSALGRMEEAARHVERAKQLDPDIRAGDHLNHYYYPIERRREEVRGLLLELGIPD